MGYGAATGTTKDSTPPLAIRERLVANVLVEHPVPEEPVERPTPTGPLPLLLTRKERRKLRTQTRVQREREKQQKIRLGLIPPPPPKANLRNFMRVHLNDGTTDPTSLEKTIREQIQQRIQNHLDRNAARALSKEERLQKKLKKLREDEAKELVCAVFRVGDLSHPQNRHIMFEKSKTLMVSGVAIMSDGGTNMVIAEGGPRSIRKFIQVLCERIDWNLPIDLTRVAPPVDEQNAKSGSSGGESGAMGDDTKPNITGGDGDEESDLDIVTTLGGGGGGDTSRPVSMIREREDNFCELVWRGTQIGRNFQQFKFHQFGKATENTTRAIRRFLRRHGVPHYLDVCLPERNPELWIPDR